MKNKSERKIMTMLKNRFFNKEYFAEKEDIDLARKRFLSTAEDCETEYYPCELEAFFDTKIVNKEDFICEGESVDYEPMRSTEVLNSLCRNKNNIKAMDKEDIHLEK